MNNNETRMGWLFNQEATEHLNCIGDGRDLDREIHSDPQWLLQRRSIQEYSLSPFIGEGEISENIRIEPITGKASRGRKCRIIWLKKVDVELSLFILNTIDETLAAISQLQLEPDWQVPPQIIYALALRRDWLNGKASKVELETASNEARSSWKKVDHSTCYTLSERSDSWTPPEELQGEEQRIMLRERAFKAVLYSANMSTYPCTFTNQYADAFDALVYATTLLQECSIEHARQTISAAHLQQLLEVIEAAPSPKQIIDPNTPPCKKCLQVLEEERKETADFFRRNGVTSVIDLDNSSVARIIPVGDGVNKSELGTSISMDRVAEPGSDNDCQYNLN